MKRMMLACAFMAILCSHAESRNNFTSQATVKHNYVHKKHRTNKDNPAVRGMVSSIARDNGVNASFAVAIARHESGFSCSAVGRAGERGVMQIKPSTARAMGYRGSASGLNNCRTGIYWGIQYLKRAISAAKGDLHRAAFLYNAGLGAKTRHPKNKSYVSAVFKKKVLTE